MPVTKRFNSLADFAADCRTPAVRPDGDVVSAWTANLSYDGAADLCLKGDTTLVAAAEALLEQLDASVETPKAQWVSSPYGGFAVVPEFLAGLPDPMRRRTPVPDETSPVRLVVDLFCSCGFSAEQMLRRGTAVLALAMKLQQLRPVQLQVVFGSKDYDGDARAVIVDLNTSPFDLATACYVLTNVGLVRQLGFRQLESIGTPAVIPAPTNGVVRDALDLGPNDLYVWPCIGTPTEIPDHEVVTNPVKWINDQLARFSGVDTEDATPYNSPTVRRPTAPEPTPTPTPDAPPQSRRGTIMSSRYAGKCAACGGHFGRGATIRYVKAERKAYHPAC
jgi:hypothetical protein